MLFRDRLRHSAGVVYASLGVYVKVLGILCVGEDIGRVNAHVGSGRGPATVSNLTPVVNLSAITRPAVLSAIREFDDLGQTAFLSRCGFAEARNFRLVHGGRFYDSKAIVGVAHGYATGYFPSSSVFSGGLDTVAACLNRLGFVVDHGGKHARGGLLWDLENTKVFTLGGKRAAYKFVVLLWAVSRKSSAEGMVPLSDARAELAGLLADFAIADSAPHPADPWVALRGSGWWSLGIPENVDGATADHQALRALTIKEDLHTGLSEPVRTHLQDSAWKAEAVAILARRVRELSSEAQVKHLVEQLNL